MSKEITDRLRAMIEQSGESRRGLSLRAGLSDSAVRMIEKHPDSSPTVETMSKLARALNVAPEWLAFGVGETSRHDGAEENLPILGRVAAGTWLEADTLDQRTLDDDLERAPIAYTNAWPKLAQYGLRVSGTSINRRAGDGDILRCIDIAQTGITPVPGDLVIVHRFRDAGQLVEMTAKVFRPAGGVIRLEPDSTDPNHQPIVLDPATAPDSVTCQIVAVVDLILRPVRRGN